MRHHAAAALYIAAIVAANLTAGWFMPLPVFGMVAVGTLFFGAIFTLRDLIHVRGRRYVYGVIAGAALINVIVAALTTTPWRIIGASFTSIVLAEIADTEAYQRWITVTPWRRITASNAISIPLDTILFTSIAFGGVLSWSDFGALLLGDTILKAVIASGVCIAVYHRISETETIPAMR